MSAEMESSCRADYIIILMKDYEDKLFFRFTIKPETCFKKVNKVDCILCWQRSAVGDVLYYQMWVISSGRRLILAKG